MFRALTRAKLARAEGVLTLSKANESRVILSPGETALLGANSPIRLTQLAFAASLGPALCYLVNLLPVRLQPRSTPPNPAILIIAAILFLGGIALDWVAERELKSGISATRWTDQEIERAQDWIRLAVFRYGIFASLFLYVAIGFFDIIANRRLAGLSLTIYPILAVARLTAATRPVAPVSLRSPQPPPAPIYSSQWGHP